MKPQTIFDLPEGKTLRQEEWTFKIPQKDNLHYYDRVIAVDIDEAWEKIRKKYPDAKVIECAGPQKLIESGWSPNRTGYEPSAFSIKMMEALGAGW